MKLPANTKSEKCEKGDVQDIDERRKYWVDAYKNKGKVHGQERRYVKNQKKKSTEERVRQNRHGVNRLHVKFIKKKEIMVKKTSLEQLAN